jgi:hypothetical protein
MPKACAQADAAAQTIMVRPSPGRAGRLHRAPGHHQQTPQTPGRRRKGTAVAPPTQLSLFR